MLDPSGAAVAGAQVTLRGEDGTAIGNAVTDNAGSFRFEKLARGLYHVGVQAAGFREMKVDVNVGQRQVSPLRISLLIAVQNEVVNVGAQDNSARVSTDVAENQNANTINETSGITYFPANSYDPAADWSRSDNDRRHKFDLLGTMHATRFFDVGAALSLYSGKPVDVTTGSDNNHDGIVNDRPEGYARNTLHGPGLIDLDLNVSRDFLLSKKNKEPRTLTVSLNSFNVLNRQNDVTLIGVITSPFFGQAVSALPPRRMQLNLQYKF